ncbi:hypothetical protein WJX84_008023, partial [Apatococcus fuscideae]
MPKKSKKSKSKRTTLRQKYKVIRKVKEHHKKKAKEAKKAGASGRKKVEKDPGIPSQYPFKEQLLKEIEFAKARALAEAAQKKEQRKLNKAAAKAAAEGGGDEEPVGLASMDGGGPAEEAMGDVPSVEGVRQQVDEQTSQYARKRPREDEGDAEEDEDLASVPMLQGADAMRKSAYREVQKVVQAADVIIQVLDARDPAATRSTEIERLIRRSSPSKRIILLLNKIDLVPREVAEQWLKHLREELPTLLKNYARNAGVKTAISVGIVGLPNVGKSSLINSLKRARAVQVGNRPGVTRTAQEVVLDKKLRLIDSPGLLFSQEPDAATQALHNTVGVEKLDDPVLPVGRIVQRCPAEQLMGVYKIPAFVGAEGLLQEVSMARGKLLPGGLPNIDAAARIVLQDWHDGKIPYYTLPPERDSVVKGSAEVVSSWANEFDADQVYAAEGNAVIQHLSSLDDMTASFSQMPSLAEPMEDLPSRLESATTAAAAAPAVPLPAGLADEADDMDESERNIAGMPLNKGKKGGGLDQSQRLYDEQGQFNPRAAKADKKRRKKQKKAGVSA